jgi:flagellar biosynthesis protein FliQ
LADQTLLTIVREGLALALLVSLPVLLVSLGVGLVVGVLQAATQLRDGTLSFVPRLAAGVAAIAAFGGWMGGEVVRYTADLWQILGEIRL